MRKLLGKVFSRVHSSMHDIAFDRGGESRPMPSVRRNGEDLHMTEPRKTIFMETTRINAERTTSEIQSILAKYGAGAILFEFEGCKISAVSFKYKVENKEIAFRLPCRWQSLETVLRQSQKNPKSGDTYETWARRVAWRQVLRWVEAQFALVETGMVKVYEVFLPYAQTKSGRTIFENIEHNNFRMLGYEENQK